MSPAFCRNAPDFTPAAFIAPPSTQKNERFEGIYLSTSAHERRAAIRCGEKGRSIFFFPIPANFDRLRAECPGVYEGPPRNVLDE
jgi:hypothetical protein